MKAVTNFFLYVWALFRSCLTYPFKSSSNSYSHLQELSLLSFQQESFSQLVKLAKREFKFILLYLHNEQHQDTEEFWENILENEAFGEFVNSREFLVKMIDIQTQEGYQISQKLQVTSYPFLGVLMVTSSDSQLIGRVEGELQLENILQALEATYERYHPVLVSEKYDANERDSARLQREEQDRAFQEALERDRQREEELREKERKEKERLEQEERERQELELKKKRIIEERHTLINKFFSDGKSLEPEKGTPNSCVIRFKFPDGSNIQRHFMKSDSVRSLYEFVFVLQPPVSSWQPSEDASIENFELSTTYPKRILDMNKTILEEKVANETLLVHENL